MLLNFNNETFHSTYDGNMTSDGRFTYTWNDENRMVSASNAEVVVTYAYDHKGRMIRKTISRGDAEPQSIEYLGDGWNIIREELRTPHSQLRTTHNLWGLDLDGTLQGAGGVGGLLAVVREDGETYIPTYDANGNVSEYVSAADGTVAAHYDYSPFGETLVASGPQAASFTHRFSTKPYCRTTGFCEYQMRKYRPDIGRWMSRDPIGEEGGVNLMIFTFNVPILKVDILGYDNWGPSAPWGGGNQNAPALPPGTNISNPFTGQFPSPGILDQFNPFGLFGRKGYEDYTRWFETRFPNTIAGAKSLIAERIVQNACKMPLFRPTQLPDMVGSDDVDIFPDMSRFGDEPESFWERHVMIGSFEIKAENITLKWITPCCFVYSATMFVQEHTGADAPWESGGEDCWEDPLWFTGLFVSRDVKMAHWLINGIGCCGGQIDYEN